jgi:hypothetical protein
VQQSVGRSEGSAALKIDATVAPQISEPIVARPQQSVTMQAPVQAHLQAPNFAPAAQATVAECWAAPD